MNKITIIGNLTKDVELSTTQTGKKVAKMAVAVARRNREETDFFNVTAWNELGENCAKYLKKGKKAAISGRMESRNYEVDGKKRVAWELTADDVEFLTPRSETAENGDSDVKAVKEEVHEQSICNDGKIRPSLEELDDDGLPF